MFDLLDYLSLILIFVFGVPHGAFDASIALTLGYYENLKSKLVFISLYILLALAVAITWYLVPTFVLIIFLFKKTIAFINFCDIKKIMKNYKDQYLYRF